MSGGRGFDGGQNIPWGRFAISKSWTERCSVLNRKKNMALTSIAKKRKKKRKGNTKTMKRERRRNGEKKMPFLCLFIFFNFSQEEKIDNCSSLSLSLTTKNNAETKKQKKTFSIFPSQLNSQQNFVSSFNIKDLRK